MILAESAAEPDEINAKRVAKASTRLLGYTIGLPSSQFEITAGYLYDAIVEGQEPDEIIDYIRHTVYRRKREDRD